MVKEVKKVYGILLIFFFLILFSFNFIFGSTLDSIGEGIRSVQEDVDKIESLFTDREFRVQYLNDSWRNYAENNSKLANTMEVTENWMVPFNWLWIFLFDVSFGFNFKFFMVFILFLMFLYFFYTLSFCLVEIIPYVNDLNKSLKSLLKYSFVFLFFLVFSGFSIYSKIISLFERWVVFFNDFHFSFGVFFSVLILIFIFFFTNSLIGLLKKQILKKLEIKEVTRKQIDEKNKKKEEEFEKEQEAKEELLEEVGEQISKEEEIRALNKQKAKEALDSVERDAKKWGF